MRPVNSTPLQQAAFSGGEMSPALQARVDLARYQIGMRRCRNFFVRQYGGIENRPGTRFIAATKNNAPVRLIPFRFNTEQAYVLECGPEYIRVFRDRAPVLDGETLIEIVSPYQAEELSELRFTQSADVLTIVHPNHPPQTLSRVSDIDWRLQAFDHINGPFQDLNADEAAWVWASAATGEVTLTANADIFVAEHVGALFYMEPRELRAVRPWEAAERDVPVGELRRSDGKVYRCVSVPDLTGLAGTPYYQAGQNRPTHEFGKAWDGPGDTKSDGTNDYKVGVEWEFVDGGFGIARIDAVTDAKTATATVLTTLPTGVVGGPVAGTSDTINATSPSVSFDLGALGFTSLSKADYSVAIDAVPITGFYISPGPFLNIYPATLNALVGPGDPYTIDVEQLDEGADGANVSNAWSFGAWSEATGYPSVVCYYADRKVFGNTPVQPQTLWMSKTGAYRDFGRSTPIVDDDAITATINARDVNEIRAIVPLDSMILLTAGAEWRVTTGQDQVLTPSTVGFKPQSYRGSSWVEPAVVGNTAIYVQDRGNIVRDLGYQFDVDGYTGAELTLFAHHLVERNEIEQIAFAQVPYSLVLGIRDDGTLLAMTYVREQEVIAWTTCDTALGRFEQVVTIPEDGEDAIYFVVAREIDGSTVRYIERLESRLFNDITDALFLDSALTFDGVNLDVTTMTITTAAGYTTEDLVTVTASQAVFSGASDEGDEIRFVVDGVLYRLTITEYTSDTVVQARPERDLPAALQATATDAWAFARDTFGGLEHLEGATVSVFADGLDAGDAVVTGGEVSLSEPFQKVSIGLPITADMETLEVNVPGGGVMFTRNKLINRVSLVVNESRNILAGPRYDKLDEWKPREEEFYDDPNALLSGLAEINIVASWAQRGRVVVRQDRPLPLSLYGIIPEVAAGD
jgi:hypothetical protein